MTNRFITEKVSKYVKLPV